MCDTTTRAMPMACSSTVSSPTAPPRTKAFCVSGPEDQEEQEAENAFGQQEDQLLNGEQLQLNQEHLFRLLGNFKNIRDISQFFNYP